MKKLAHAASFLAILVALGVGAWLAARGTAPDRRNLDALVTVGGDAMRDAIHPAIDLTRLSGADEVKLGAAIDREVRAAKPIGGDPRDEAYLQQIATDLAKSVTRHDIPYTIAILRNEEVNAFALPGGRLYVTEGMLRFVQSEAELAAVIGHEISHVDLRHCVDRLQFEVAARKISPAMAPLGRLGYELMLRGFSEEQELAADANGALLAAAALYDPWETRSLFRRMLLKEGESTRPPTRNPVVEAARVIPEALGRYLATHPPADQRMEIVRRALMAQPRTWRGVRLYVGRANLAARRSRLEETHELEWIVRSVAPQAL